MTYDISPLMRTAIGFDRFARLMDNAANVAAPNNSYPPYNIDKQDADTYRLTMAVAGFGSADIDITLADNNLVIKGTPPARFTEGEMLHRGIAARAFERHFVLADHIEIGEAELVNGLLTVTIKRVVPEALAPRRIEIKSVEALSASAKAEGSKTQRNAA
ncbi:MAG: Hsp20 family protein [Acetobacteraceae bacterium]